MIATLAVENYRTLRLLADAARNGAVAALAREGGLPSTLWAGPETIGRAVREGTYARQAPLDEPAWRWPKR